MSSSEVQGSVNRGFQTVVRGWFGEQIPAPHRNLNLASIIPLFYLKFTSFEPFPCQPFSRALGRISDFVLIFLAITIF